MPKAQHGFSYIAVLAALVVMGILAGKATNLTSAALRADRESELMFRGMAYQRAIQSYYESDQGFRRYPTSLDDLLSDSRFISRRHLRKSYVDPVGDAWILIPSPDGGIMGVSSSSEQKPSKKANFPVGLESFEEAETYRDWVFVFRPAVTKIGASVGGVENPP
jgi:type II secretory pathway pseudopilin PulG